MDMIGRLNKRLVLQGIGSSSIWRGEIERRNVEAADATLEESKAKRAQAQFAFDARIGEVSTVVLRAEQDLRAAQAAETTAQIALESTINGENTTRFPSGE